MTTVPCPTTIAMRLACASLSTIADPNLHPIARDRLRGTDGGSATRRFVGHAHALALRFLEVRARRLKQLASIGVPPASAPWSQVDQHALEFLVAQVQSIPDPKDHPIAKERAIGRRGAADRVVCAAYELAESFMTHDLGQVGEGGSDQAGAGGGHQAPARAESWGVLGGMAGVLQPRSDPEATRRPGPPASLAGAARA